MKRIEVNCATGEVKEIDLTPEEAAAVTAAQAAEAAKVKEPTIEDRIAALELAVFK